MSIVCLLRIVLTACVLVGVLAEDEVCYTPGGVAGIVIATIVVTLVMGGLAAAGVWYLWKMRSGEKGFFSEKKESPPDKKGTENSATYAFDNPYFKDDEADAAEKGVSGFQKDNGDISRSPNAKQHGWQLPTKTKWTRPFSAVFQQSGAKKPRAFDDTCITKQVERVTVPLRGHDFTGLGFNICGNMRDGIFVKDVLHRGPASESGKIKAGDRIVGVSVSFSGMVYEDALTILSYASPYDVQLEIEKGVTLDGVPLAAVGTAALGSSPGGGKRLISSSFRSGGAGQRLFHPLYRSQSIDDLTQIGKDGGLQAGSLAGPRGSSGPRRSQSIEATTSPKSRPQAKHPEVAKTGDNTRNRKSSDSSVEAAKKKAANDTPKSEHSLKDVNIKNESPKNRSSRFYLEEPSLQKSAPQTDADNLVTKEKATTVDVAPPLPKTQAPEVVKEPLRSNEEKGVKSSIESEKTTKNSDGEEGEGERPAVPPRKVVAPGKRKAPAPPKSTTETCAVIHRAESESAEQKSSTSSAQTAMANDAVSETSKDKTSEMNSAESAKDASSGSPKRKAASLGDLTNLDENRKKSPTSTTILERAVSLDLQQQQPMPVDNLGKQKQILRAPTFEDPEDTSQEEDFGSSAEDQTSGVLKRWDNNWNQIQHDSGRSDPSFSSSAANYERSLTNGHSSVGQENGKNSPTSDLLEKDRQMLVDGEETKLMTSTPAKKVIEIDSFLKGDVDIDRIPYLGETNADPEANASSSIENSSQSDPRTESPPLPPLIPPVSVSIPVIKPDFSQYEKLPSPTATGASHYKDTNENKVLHGVHIVTKDAVGKKLDLDFSANQERDQSTNDFRPSSYKSVLYNESTENNNSVLTISCVPDTSDNRSDDSISKRKDTDSSTKSADPFDVLNGNGSGYSSPYQSAHEESFSSFSGDTTQINSRDLAKKHSITMHSGVAGFAKTLIVSSSEEIDTLTLLDDPDVLPSSQRKLPSQ